MTRISVLIPTHNRAESLRETLAAVGRTDRRGLDVNVVVIDNNSTDATARVAGAEWPVAVQYLFEPAPGKNRALNRGLTEGALGELVVFTDDDVTPHPDWLQAIAAATARWPKATVFGGPIRPVWPMANPPAWARDPSIQGWAFSRLDFGRDDRPWPKGHYPYGPNYWLRRTLIDRGARFDGALGPNATGTIMGDETRFLKDLMDAGEPCVYAAGAVVDHRLQPGMLTVSGLRRRAASYGRASPHLYGTHRSRLYRYSPAAWRVARYAAAARWTVVRGALGLLPGPLSPVLTLARCERLLARNLEHLRLDRKNRPRGVAQPSPLRTGLDRHT